jgi:hypothetical protein
MSVLIVGDGPTAAEFSDAFWVRTGRLYGDRIVWMGNTPLRARHGLTGTVLVSDMDAALRAVSGFLTNSSRVAHTVGVDCGETLVRELSSLGVSCVNLTPHVGVRQHAGGIHLPRPRT